MLRHVFENQTHRPGVYGSTRFDGGLARAESSDQPALYKAYYLEKEAKDYAAAQKNLRASGRRRCQLTDRQGGAGGAGSMSGLSRGAEFRDAHAARCAGLHRAEQTRAGFGKAGLDAGLTGKDMQQLYAQRPSTDAKEQRRAACIPPWAR